MVIAAIPCLIHIMVIILSRDHGLRRSGQSSLTGAIDVGSKLSSFLTELKRRKVYRAAAVYAAVGVAVAVAVPDLFSAFDLPSSAARFVIVVIVIGLPITLVLAWAYELRPEDPREAAAVLDRSEQVYRKSIIVLPFDNMSPDPGDAYFSDGLTEEIIARLSNLQSLRVISRSSAMVLKGTQKDVRTIGKELDVQFVLEGSVRKAGNDLRITAQLIDAATDAHLWSERYEGVLDDVFEIQETVSQSIVGALNLTLSVDEQKKLAERPFNEIRAYECYLRARIDIHNGTAESLKSARRHLEAGLEILGENELLYEGLAEFHLMAYEYGAYDAETLQRAEGFAAKAMVLQPESAGSHYLKGRIERLRGSPLRAARHYQNALEIDPSHAGALYWLLAVYTNQAGRPRAGDTLMNRLLEVDPLSPLTGFGVGWHHWLSGRFEEALATLDGVLKLQPDFLWASLVQSHILIWQEDRDEALEILGPIARRDPRDIFADWAILLNNALAGDSARAVESLSEETRRFFWNDPELPALAAPVYALAGAEEEALTWLERAIQRGWVNYPLFAHQDPLLENIRGTARFGELMAGVRAKWEMSEV